MAEILEYLVRLRGGTEAAGELDAVGGAAEKTGHALRGIAGLAIGGLGLFAGFEGLKSAVENTQKLAISGSTLAKVTGMNVNQSTQFLSVVDAFGVSSRTATMSLKTLSTQAENALGGTKKSRDAFKLLGISMDDLHKHGKNVNDLLGFVSDRLNRLPGGAQKTAIASQLLGRGWMQLAPLLAEGSKGMRDLEKTAAAYGVTLGKDPLENARKLHEAEVKLKLAQTGLEVQLSEHLAPAFIKVLNKGLDVYKAIRTRIGPAFAWLGQAIKDVTKWLKSHADAAYALKVGLGVLVGALIAVKLATLAANLALLGSPIGWIILGIAALAAGLVYAWKHFKTFRDVVNDVWNWLKTAVVNTVGFVKNHWKLLVTILTFPFVGVAGFVATHFSAIKGIITSVLNWIIDRVNDVINAVNSVSGSIPFVGGSLHIGTIGHVGGGGSPVTGTVPTRNRKLSYSQPGHQGAAHVKANAVMGSGDVILKVGQHEFARVAKRTLWDAMAANA